MAMLRYKIKCTARNLSSFRTTLLSSTDKANISEKRPVSPAISSHTKRGGRSARDRRERSVWQPGSDAKTH